MLAQPLKRVNIKDVMLILLIYHNSLKQTPPKKNTPHTIKHRGIILSDASSDEG